METSLITRAFAVLLLVGLPLMSVRDQLGIEELEESGANRNAIYVSGALSLAILAGITALVAGWQGLAAGDLGWRTGARTPMVAWSLAAAVAGLLLAWAGSRILRRFEMAESPLTLYLLPRTRSERWGFVLLALAAALCEEYLYRGFALHVLEAWTGDPWPAVAITSVSFGLAHGYQRVAGMVRASLLGAILAIPVVATGSLFPAVAAHFWINAVLGLGGWKWIVPEEQLPG